MQGAGEGGLQVGLVAVGLGRDGPRAGERARRKRNRGLGQRLRAEEGERTDARAPSSRERRRGAGERALLGCEAGERVRGRWEVDWAGERERRRRRLGPRSGVGLGFVLGFPSPFSISFSFSQTNSNLIEFK